MKIITLACIGALSLSLGACVKAPPATEVPTQTATETAPAVNIDGKTITISDLTINVPDTWEIQKSDDFLFEAGSQEGSISISSYLNNVTIDDLLSSAQEQLIDIGAKNLSITKTNYKFKGEEKEGLRMEYELYGQKLYQSQMFIPKDNQMLAITISSAKDNIQDIYNYIR